MSVKIQDFVIGWYHDYQEILISTGRIPRGKVVSRPTIRSGSSMFFGTSKGRKKSVTSNVSIAWLTSIKYRKEISFREEKHKTQYLVDLLYHFGRVGLGSLVGKWFPALRFGPDFGFLSSDPNSTKRHKNPMKCFPRFSKVKNFPETVWSSFALQKSPYSGRTAAGWNAFQRFDKFKIFLKPFGQVLRRKYHLIPGVQPPDEMCFPTFEICTKDRTKG